MTIQQSIGAAPCPGVRIVDSPNALSAIREPDCAAAVSRRHAPASFVRWIDGLDPDQLPRMRGVIRPEDARDALVQTCLACGTPDTPERAWFIDDITQQVEAFTGLIGAPNIRLRLDVVRTNACRRFHVDAVVARLICTYRGTGTQYGTGRDGADPDPIFTMPTGAPIVLRGRLWPEKPDAGLLHRSPPIEGTDETRLLLVIDPIWDSEDAD